jgi:hypothetical protein
MSVDWMSTSALAPGYATAIWTCGGAISGNCEIGRARRDSTPRRTITIESDDRQDGAVENLCEHVGILIPRGT